MSSQFYIKKVSRCRPQALYNLVTIGKLKLLCLLLYPLLLFRRCCALCPRDRVTVLPVPCSSCPCRRKIAHHPRVTAHTWPCCLSCKTSIYTTDTSPVACLKLSSPAGLGLAPATIPALVRLRDPGSEDPQEISRDSQARE